MSFLMSVNKQVNPIWPGDEGERGGTNPFSCKKCHNFWKDNGIDMEFYDFS